MGDLNPDDSRMGIYLSRSSHSSVSVFQLDSTAFLSGAQSLENLYNYSEILRKGSDKNGTTLQELKELGGWSSFEMVLRYAHLDGDHQKHTAERIAIDGLVLTKLKHVSGINCYLCARKAP